MMSLWDALRMNMMISYQELVRTFLKSKGVKYQFRARIDDTPVFYPERHHGVICGDAIGMGPAPD
ncbi:hypothetical protein AAHX32_27935 (plasmid) [Klebsiella pneumoniae]